MCSMVIGRLKSAPDTGQTAKIDSEHGFCWWGTSRLHDAVLPLCVGAQLPTRRCPPSLDQLHFFNVFFLSKKKSKRCEHKPPIISNLKYAIWAHRPSIKGTKLLFIVIKAIIISQLMNKSINSWINSLKKKTLSCDMRKMNCILSETVRNRRSKFLNPKVQISEDINWKWPKSCLRRVLFHKKIWLQRIFS